MESPDLEPNPKRQKPDSALTDNNRDARRIYPDCAMDDDLNKESGWLVGVTNPAQWLTDHYGKPRNREDVVIQFSDRNDTYYFSRQELLERFEYFQKALCTDKGVPRWEEDVSNSCRPDVTSQDFGWVWRWIEIDLGVEHAFNEYGYFIDDCDVWTDCDAVEDFLQATVAADYLLLDDKFKLPFLNNMARLVAFMLKRDRRNLTAADIKFVQTHRPFATKESYGFLDQLEWGPCNVVSELEFLDIFAIAAVRPFLQAGMASDGYRFTRQRCNQERLEHPSSCATCRDNTLCPSLRLPQAGHEKFEDWCAIIEHCKLLMSGNLAFSFAVMQAVSATLTEQLCYPEDDTTTELVARQRYENPLTKYLGTDYGTRLADNDGVDSCFVI